ncbi:MAG: hypothetical protein WDA22_11640 [Bacteroidota bacterium]
MDFRKSFIFLFVSIVGLSCKNSTDNEIFYVSKDISEIFTVYQDGSGLRQLTNEKQFIHYADFIPNSSKIYYVQSKLGAGYQGIFTLDLKTGQKDSLCVANIFQSTHYVDIPHYKRILVSSDGKEIFFASWESNDANLTPRNIFKVNIQTKVVTNITNNTPGNRINEICLSFDNTKIVYSEIDQTNKLASIYIYDIGTNNKKKIYSSSDGTCYHPQILSDNKRIFFVEIDNSDTKSSKLKIVRADSINNVTAITIQSLGFGYYPELSVTNDIIIDVNDSIPFLVIFNIDTQKQINTNIPNTNSPYLSKNEKYMLYFKNNWSLGIVTINSMTEQMILSTTNYTGSTHLPKTSYANNEIIFINRKTLKE